MFSQSRLTEPSVHMLSSSLDVLLPGLFEKHDLSHANEREWSIDQRRQQQLLPIFKSLTVWHGARVRTTVTSSSS